MSIRVAGLNSDLKRLYGEKLDCEKYDQLSGSISSELDKFIKENSSNGFYNLDELVDYSFMNIVIVTGVIHAQAICMHDYSLFKQFLSHTPEGSDLMKNVYQKAKNYYSKNFLDANCDVDCINAGVADRIAKSRDFDKIASIITGVGLFFKNRSSYENSKYMEIKNISENLRRQLKTVK